MFQCPVFFFSSRIRHTRLVSDWSSDVCSSDLVTTGDLDGDGRLDIVATSWGRNTKSRVDPDHPLLLYYGDFTGSRRWDVRSEERRVGKECRKRGGPHQQNKRNK